MLTYSRKQAVVSKANQAEREKNARLEASLVELKAIVESPGGTILLAGTTTVSQLTTWITLEESLVGLAAVR